MVKLLLAKISLDNSTLNQQSKPRSLSGVVGLRRPGLATLVSTEQAASPHRGLACYVSHVMMLGVEGLENIQGYRIMKLAIKKPKAVFWKTDLRVEDIQKMLQAERITEEWLVCPQGDGAKSILFKYRKVDKTLFDYVRLWKVTE